MERALHVGLASLHKFFGPNIRRWRNPVGVDSFWQRLPRVEATLGFGTLPLWGNKQKHFRFRGPIDFDGGAGFPVRTLRLGGRNRGGKEGAELTRRGRRAIRDAEPRTEAVVGLEHSKNLFHVEGTRTATPEH
jgi:hypothetical protein